MLSRDLKQERGTKSVKEEAPVLGKGAGPGKYPTAIGEIYEERNKGGGFLGKEPSGQVQKPGAEAGWVCLRKSQEAHVSEAQRAEANDGRTESNDG